MIVFTVKPISNTSFQQGHWILTRIQAAASIMECRASAFSSNTLEEQGPHHKRPYIRAPSSKRLEEQGPHHKRPRMQGQSPQQQQPSRTRSSPEKAKYVRPKASAAKRLKNKVFTTGGQSCKAKALSSKRLEEQGPHHKRPRM